MGSWSHFPHDADIGLLGEGDSPEEAFEMAATALTAVVTRPEDVLPILSRSVYCQAPNIDILLLDWLNSIIYEMVVENMLFSRFYVTIKDLSLTAHIHGEGLDRQRHNPAVEPKGATMTELSVRHIDNHWKAYCVIDV